MRKFILFLAMFICSTGLWSQDGYASLKTSTFLAEDGLSQSSIQGTAQDVFGFIWVSTGDGLNCFDGKTFKRYYYHSLIQGSNQSNSMRNLICDSIGNLWVGTDRGLLYLNRANDRLVQAFVEIPEMNNQACLPLFCNADSITVLVGNKGVLSIHIQQQKFRRIPLKNSLEGLALLGETQTKKWFRFSKYALGCFTNIAGSGIEFKEYKSGDFEGEYFVGVVKLAEGRSLLASARNLYFISEISGEVVQVNLRSWPFLPEDSRIEAILKDTQNMIWLVTSNHGVFLLNVDFSLYKHLRDIEEDGKGQNKFSNITTIFNDRTGNTWIGTDGSGLKLYHSHKPRFGLIDQIDLGQGKISKPFIRCFFQDEKNQLWIGTYNLGLICWNRNSNSFSQNMLEERTGFPSANDIYCLSPFSENRMLVGTSSGIWVINKPDQTAYPYNKLLDRTSIQKVTCIIPRGDNSFEILINNRPQRVTIHDNNLSLSSSVFPDSAFYDKISAGQGEMLYAFSKTGFFQAENGNLTYHGYTYKGHRVKLKVNAVHSTQAGILWLATDHGLIQMEPSGNILTIFNETDGFPNHYLYGILPANGHTLWISSNRGLTEFDTESRQTINYGMEDGLQSLEFNSGAFYSNTNGELFFGGISGFNYFHPDSINTRSVKPAIWVSNVLVNDQVYQSDSCWMAKKALNLPYKQNTVTFGLSVIDFAQRGSMMYSYMLEGHDQKWISAEDLNQIRYSKLTPGKYAFKIIAATDNKISGSKPLILQLQIQKPFWMKTSFQIGSIVIFILIIILIVRYFSILNIKKQIAKLERQREISLIRRRIASDLHDDVGSGLSKLAMMSDKARLNSTDEIEFSQYLTKISGEARRMIDQLRVIVWTLNPQEDKLDGLIAYINRQISDYLEDFPVHYKILIPAEIPVLTVTPEFKRNVYYAIREAVHNILKHAEAKNLQLQIEINKKYMKVSIGDNGKGFDIMVQKTYGNGIKIMEKRITDLSGEVKISSEPGSGTTVEFYIPI